MTFLNPFMLLGLAAAAIPVLVHLFNLRRPKRVDFSSLVFVRELQRRTMRRLRIKQWLLLALRVLAIAFLVLAFARPTLEGSMVGTVGDRLPSSSVIVVDNSLSMTLRDGQGEYLDQAKEKASGLLEEAAPEDEIFILPTAGDTLAPTAYSTREAAQDALEALEVQPGGQSLARAAGRAASLLKEAAHPRRQIYLISDLQQSTLVDSLATAAVPEEVGVRLLPVGSGTPANVAVTEVQVRSRILEVGQPVRFSATLRNFGSEALDGYVASVYLEGERVAQATADLPAGQQASVEFTATPQQRGWLAGRVEVEDDDFSADNTRYFSVHVPEERQLLVVRGDGQRTEYMETALSPELREGRQIFSVETISESALSGTSLEEYETVTLVGPQSLSSGERSALVRYVEAGGGLLLFPSAQAEIEDYNALLEALGGGRLEGFSGSEGGEQLVATFDQVDLEHPLFEGVFDRSREEAEPERPEVYFAINYAPRSGTEQTLIELSNGRPFLQEMRHGRGAALVMTTAPDPAWSDLPTRGLFVPLLYRSFYYLSSTESVAGAQLTAGRAETLRIPGGSVDEALRLVGPEGEERIPEQQRLFGAMLLEVDPLRTLGIYEAYAGSDLVQRLAVNLDARESDLARHEASEAAERLAEATGAPVRVLETEADAAIVAEALETEQAGVEIWNVFLMAALALLVAEMLVSRYGAAEPRKEAVAA